MVSIYKERLTITLMSLKMVLSYFFKNRGYVVFQNLKSLSMHGEKEVIAICITHILQYKKEISYNISSLFCVKENNGVSTGREVDLSLFTPLYTRFN